VDSQTRDVCKSSYIRLSFLESKLRTCRQFVNDYYHSWEAILSCTIADARQLLFRNV
jgi:hypothetical protein